jgi:MFS family permease
MIVASPRRRLLVLLVGSVALLETLLLSAIAPLLPGFEQDLGLSKAEVGILNAAYPLGAFCVAVPAGMLGARFGLRRAVFASVLALAIGTAAFGVLDSFEGLTIARFVQGAAGGGIAWPIATAWLVSETALERRATILGAVIGISIFGATLGPALGAIATADRAVTFLALAGITFAALGLLAGLRSPPRSGGAGFAAVRVAFADRDVQRGLVFVIVPGALFGIVGTLLPLQLDRLGSGAGAVAAVFVVSAGIGAIVSTFVGRLCDRVGRRAPLRFAVIASPFFALVLPHVDNALAAGAFAVVSMSVWGVFWPPAMALLSDGAHRVGVEQALAFAIQSMAWGPGAFIGALGGGFLAGVAGDGVAWAVVAVACAVTLPLIPRTR